MPRSAPKPSPFRQGYRSNSIEGEIDTPATRKIEDSLQEGSVSVIDCVIRAEGTNGL